MRHRSTIIRTRLLLSGTALISGLICLSSNPAIAACTTLGGVTTCEAAAPNPWTTRVGEGNTAAGDNRTVDVQNGSEISTGNDNAISLRDNADITIRNGATVTNAATTSNGQFSTGGNTIEIRNNGTVTVEEGGQLFATGTQVSAEAVNFQGTGNTLINDGTIDAERATAIWSQNTGGLNTVINNETGIIEAGNGTTSTVIGGSGNGALDFTNRGTVRGSIRLAGGNDILRLFTGSTVTGSFSGGAGNDQIFLSGTGQSTLPGDFVGFESLIKNETGTWTLSGTITGVTVSDVQEGTLVLTGDNANYTGQILVQPDGSLEARAQSLPPTVTNDGLVRFAQPDDGNYAGTIAGDGAIEKTGLGALTLSGDTDIAGNTGLNEGTLIMASGGVLTSAGVVMGDATTLQLDGAIEGAGGGPATITGQTGMQTVIINADYTGAVNLGDDDDTFILTDGIVDGVVDQGDGNDLAQIEGGTLTGNLQQGNGTDDFQMTGGQIQSLNQGDGLDTFTMSDGRIVDFFDDGDHAVMTGGRIGRVNMKLDDNTFDMSGGTIDKNLVTGFGNDTIILSAGTIGGNISVSGGTDSVTVTGGTVGGEVRMSAGTDTFTWDGGGIIYGAIDLGGDDDMASLSNLTNANIGATPQITGGVGTDSLTFDNVKTGDVARFDSWETIDLTNDSQLVFDGTLTLGDSGTGTGTLSVDAASTIFGGGQNGAVSAFDNAQFANVVNAGRIDLTNGGSSTSDTFTIFGNYTGNGGQVFLDTVLGDDASASDKLVIDSGIASGTTGMNIINAGGSGAVTAQDGIMVVEALNGAATESGAFALNSRVAAGAYEYYLFKGGVSAGSDDNWYLRSTILPNSEVAAAPDPVEPSPPAPEPEEPEVAPPPPPSELPSTPLPSEGDETTEPADPTSPVDVSDPEPAAPPAPPPAEPADPPAPPPAPPSNPAPIPIDETSTPPTPGATRVVADVVPLYRIEVPTYSVVPLVASHMAFSTLGTFHERRGEQILLNGAGGYLPATWGRVFGQDTEMNWSGAVDPSFDGSLFGFQAGQDVFGRETDNGHIDRFGLFVGYAHMSGDIRGQALGWNNLAVGDLDFSGTSFGGYWTHIGPGGWYLDGVLMGTWFDGDISSKAGQKIDIGGSAVTASLEGGYPIALNDQWTLEPQGQIVWNHLSLDDQADSFSTVTFDGDDAVRGRLGVRLQGKYETGSGTLQPYLKANIWHDFSAEQTVHFGGDPIVTEIKGTSLEIGGGIVAALTNNLSLFATADYTTNLGGEKTHTWEGNLGLNVKW